jgi:predicted flap endonuclease-1-like 5' DNA nuclease
LACAKLLTDCDLMSVEELAEADADRLSEALRRRGAPAPMLARVADWVEGAGDGLERWRASGFAESWRRNRGERRERIRENASRRRDRGERSFAAPERRERRRSERQPREEKKPTKPRFYLDPDSDIEAAPSIGPKRAAQLTKIGIRSVSQLLAADPQDLASRLGDDRIDAAAIVAWQHQAGLMCRVPGLRGHDAMVLVGSGFTSADELAGMKPAELLEFVEPFCDSSDGERALRGSPRPDLAEVTQWIQAARQRRSLSVA